MGAYASRDIFNCGTQRLPGILEKDATSARDEQLSNKSSESASSSDEGRRRRFALPGPAVPTVKPFHHANVGGICHIGDFACGDTGRSGTTAVLSAPHGSEKHRAARLTNLDPRHSPRRAAQEEPAACSSLLEHDGLCHQQQNQLGALLDPSKPILLHSPTDTPQECGGRHRARGGTHRAIGEAGRSVSPDSDYSWHEMITERGTSPAGRESDRGETDSGPAAPRRGGDACRGRYGNGMAEMMLPRSEVPLAGEAGANWDTLGCAQGSVLGFLCVENAKGVAMGLIACVEGKGVTVSYGSPGAKQPPPAGAHLRTGVAQAVGC